MLTQQQQYNKQGQSGFFQCAIFYGVPLANELVEWENDRTKKKCPKNLRHELETQRFVFPFYSNEIFPTSAQAQAFFPEFINRLIKDGFIPPDVIDAETHLLNDEVCKAAVVPLKFSVIDLDKETVKEG